MTGQAACEQVSPLSLGVCQHSTTGTGQELEQGLLPWRGSVWAGKGKPREEGTFWRPHML